MDTGHIPNVVPRGYTFSQWRSLCCSHSSCSLLGVGGAQCCQEKDHGMYVGDTGGCICMDTMCVMVVPYCKVIIMVIHIVCIVRDFYCV